MEPAAPGTEDDASITAPPALSKKASDDERLLAVRAYLPSGRYGNVFTKSYNDGMEQWYCNVCECPVMGRVFHHESGKRHTQRMEQTNPRLRGGRGTGAGPGGVGGFNRSWDEKKQYTSNPDKDNTKTPQLNRENDVPGIQGREDKSVNALEGGGVVQGNATVTTPGLKVGELLVAPGEPEPPGAEGEITKIAQIQARLDRFKASALLGLEYLLEITDYDADKEPSYLCALCDKKGDPRTVVAHLVSYNHLQQYMQRHFPATYRALSPYITRQFRKNWQDAMNSIAEAIEMKYGRLLPHPVDCATFERKKDEYFKMIHHGPHFSEKNGITFENMVVPDQLTKVLEVEDGGSIPTENKEEAAKAASSAEDAANVENKKRNPSPPTGTRSKRSKIVDGSRRESLSSVSSLSSVDLTTGEKTNKSVAKGDRKRSERGKNKSRSRSTSPITRNESPSRGRGGTFFRGRGARGARGSSYRGAYSTTIRRSRSRSRSRTRSRSRDRSRLPWQRSDYGRKRPESTTTSADQKRAEVSKFEEFNKLTAAIEGDMLKTYKSHEKNPEKHPQYNEEWKMFWNRRYKELQLEGKDANNYDYKPEWIMYWGTRMQELHAMEVKSRKDALRKRLGMREEPPPISFRIGKKISNSLHGPNIETRRPIPTAAQPDQDHEVIIIDDKTNSPERAHSPWEEDTPTIVSSSISARPATVRNNRRSRSRDRNSSRRSADRNPIRRRSPDRNSRDKRNISPDRRRSRDRDRKIISPDRRRSRDRAVSPERRRSRDRAISPERRRSRDRAVSPERRRSRDRAVSPDRRRSPVRKVSPDRLRSRDRNNSSDRRRSRDRNISADRRRSRDRDHVQRKIESKPPAKDFRDIDPFASRPPREATEKRRSRDRETPLATGGDGRRSRSDNNARERSRDKSLSSHRRSSRSPRSTSRERYYRNRDLFERERSWERVINQHREMRTMASIPDAYKPPMMMRGISTMPVYPGNKNMDELPDPVDDGEISVVSVLRLLTALEDKLGSLGPKVIDLLAYALAMEKNEPNSSETLLDNEVNCVLFETLKEKLKGALLAGLIAYNQEKVVKHAMKKLASLIHMGSERKRDRIDKDKVNPLQVAGVGAVDKAAIATQIATALVLQGKTDVTQAELETLINAVVGMAEASKNSDKPVSTASFLNKLSEKPSEVVVVEAKVVEEPTKDLELSKPDKHQEEESNAMDGLSDADLQTLLQNFKDLSSVEQHGLITYLKKLEAKEPQRVEKLRQFVNTGGPAAAKVTEPAKEEPKPEPPKIKFDSDDEEYSYEDVFNVAKQNVKQKEEERKRERDEEKRKRKEAQAKTAPDIDYSEAQAIIANLMGLGKLQMTATANATNSSNLTNANNTTRLSSETSRDSFTSLSRSDSQQETAKHANLPAPTGVPPPSKLQLSAAGISAEGRLDSGSNSNDNAPRSGGLNFEPPHLNFEPPSSLGDTRQRDSSLERPRGQDFEFVHGGSRLSSERISNPSFNITDNMMGRLSDDFAKPHVDDVLNMRDYDHPSGHDNMVTMSRGVSDGRDGLGDSYRMGYGNPGGNMMNMSSQIPTIGGSYYENNSNQFRPNNQYPQQAFGMDSGYGNPMHSSGGYGPNNMMGMGDHAHMQQMNMYGNSGGGGGFLGNPNNNQNRGGYQNHARDVGGYGNNSGGW